VLHEEIEKGNDCQVTGLKPLDSFRCQKSTKILVAGGLHCDVLAINAGNQSLANSHKQKHATSTSSTSHAEPEE
jgi:hypothetical protein